MTRARSAVHLRERNSQGDHLADSQVRDARVPLCARHLGDLPAGQDVANIGALASTVVVPLIAAGLIRPEPARRSIS